MLRVDTERRFLPHPKGWDLAPSKYQTLLIESETTPGAPNTATKKLRIRATTAMLNTCRNSVKKNLNLPQPKRQWQGLGELPVGFSVLPTGQPGHFAHTL
jgi:hypothetical protein